MKCIEFKVNKLVYIDQSGQQHDITPNNFSYAYLMKPLNLSFNRGVHKFN